MDYPASTCLQCGTDDHQWDGNLGSCDRCGFDSVRGFSPVPQIYEHFLQSVLRNSMQPMESSTPAKLMAEFRRVFPTPEELADGWNFLREHPQYAIDVLRSTTSALH